MNGFSGKQKFIFNMFSLRYLRSVWVAVISRSRDLYGRIINIHAMQIVYIRTLTCSGKEKWGPGTHLLQAEMSKGRMKEKRPAKQTVAGGLRVAQRRQSGVGAKREGSFEKLELRQHTRYCGCQREGVRWTERLGQQATLVEWSRCRTQDVID